MKEVLKTRMHNTIDVYLDQARASGLPARRIVSFPSHLLTEVVDLEFQLPETRTSAPIRFSNSSPVGASKIVLINKISNAFKKSFPAYFINIVMARTSYSVEFFWRVCLPKKFLTLGEWNQFILVSMDDQRR